MAHKKAASSTDNGRDSISKRLGVKLFGGQTALAGNIIVRQRGTRYHAGLNTYLGKDFTLHAKVDGIVSFQKRKYNRTFVNITPLEVLETPAAKRVVAKKAAAKVVNDNPQADEAKIKAAADAAAKAAADQAAAEKAAADAAEKAAVDQAAAEKAAADAAAKSAADQVATEKAAADAAAKAAADQAAAEKAAADAAAKSAADQAATEKATADAAAKAAADQAAAEKATADAAPLPVVSDAPATEDSAPALPKGVKQDDLTLIEGVGPKIAEHLTNGGFDTWAKVADASVEDLQAILDAAGPRYNIHNPGSWPKQAGLAAAGKWDELKTLQDELDGGV